MRALALLPILLLAACGDSGGGQASVYEKIVVDNVPTKNADAVTTYFRDCSGASPEGRVTCHECDNEIFVGKDGKIDIYADNNEHTIEGAPAKPELKVTGELSHQYDHALPEAVKAEHAKGADSFQKYLTGLFEKGNAWCAALGGTRHDLKNEIAASLAKVEG